MFAYSYRPPFSTTVTKKSTRPALIRFILRLNGVPVKPPLIKIDLGDLVIMTGAEKASCTANGDKLRIEIPCELETVVVGNGYAGELMFRYKDNFPSLFLGIKKAYKPMPMVDLETGKRLSLVVTCEYGFQDPATIENIVSEIVEPASVFFDCKQSSGQVFFGECKSGRIRYPSKRDTSPREWHLAHLGLIDVPPEIDWSPEDIQEAFTNLAKNLLNQPDDPSVQIFKFKDITLI